MPALFDVAGFLGSYDVASYPTRAQHAHGLHPV